MTTPIYDSTVADHGYDPIQERREPWSFADALRRIESSTTYKKKMRAVRSRIEKEARNETQ